MTCGIYAIENVTTGHIYIGRSVNVPKRIDHHFWKLANQRHNNPHLQSSFDKHGRSVFIWRLLLVCRPQDLPLYEKLAIKGFDAGNRECGFNLMAVGDDGHYVHGPEARAKSTAFNLERWKDPAYRAKRSEQQKAIIAKQWADPEFRKLRSKAVSAQWKSPKQREMFRERRSASLKKLWSDPAYRAKRRASQIESLKGPLREKIASAMRDNWANPEYRNRVLASRAAARQAKGAQQNGEH